MWDTNFILALLSLYPISFGTLCFHFSFSQVICWFFPRFLLWPIGCLRVVLLSFYVFVDFLVFLLLLISSFYPLWLIGKDTLYDLNLLRFVLWPTMWYVLENVSSASEKNVFCQWGECSAVSVRSCCLWCCSGGCFFIGLPAGCSFHDWGCGFSLRLFL